MAKQPEQILEEQLVEQLQKLNYSLVYIKDEKIYRTETKIQQTGQYKKGLLQNMFV